MRLAALMVLASFAAFAEDTHLEPQPPAFPSVGVDPAPRRGTFAETALGAFASLGGSGGVSAVQPYLSLTAGHNLGERSTLFVSLGIGASSQSCFDRGASGCAAADSFGATFLEVGASTGTQIAPRTLLSAKVLGGVGIFSPGPFAHLDGSVPDRVIAPHLGAGVGLDYDTHLDHFSIGLDALARYSVASKPDGQGREGIASIAFLPRIRYVF
ncbi:MAG: adventurous gliding motility protein CglE [Myxococcales bacterium]